VENPCVERGVRGSHGAGDHQHHDEPEKSVPPATGHKQRSNNKMALQNIRERLDLLFDAEARYQVEAGKNFYRVDIVLPYVKVRPS
jgi:LytS/YehU family sensor histidine kinase